MKNLVIILLCVGFLFFALKSCNTEKTKTIEAQKSTISLAKPTISLTDMDGINYKISQLTDSTLEYLKNKSEYKSLFDNSDRKIVIYYVGANCPYAQAFIDALKPIEENPQYSSEFIFQAKDISSGLQSFETMEDAQAEVNFSNTCHEFCIINPKNNEIFAIEGTGLEEAKKLPDIIEQLRNW